MANCNTAASSAINASVLVGRFSKAELIKRCLTTCLLFHMSLFESFVSVIGILRRTWFSNLDRAFGTLLSSIFFAWRESHSFDVCLIPSSVENLVSSLRLAWVVFAKVLAISLSPPRCEFMNRAMSPERCKCSITSINPSSLPTVD